VVIGALLPIKTALAQQSAIDQARMALAALHDQDWRSISQMTDSGLSVRFHQNEIAGLVAWAEAMQNRSPGNTIAYAIPDTVSAERLAGVGGATVPPFRGRPTIDSLSRMSPIDFLALFLEATHGDPLQSNNVKRAPILQRQVVGGVLVNDTLAHVLYSRVGAMRYRNTLDLEVVSLRLVRVSGVCS
jgi:hypothetical protein